MSTYFAEDFHTLQHLLLEVRTSDVLAWEGTVGSVELEGLNSFPDTIDLGRWQGDHCVKCQSANDLMRLSMV